MKLFLGKYNCIIKRIFIFLCTILMTLYTEFEIKFLDINPDDIRKRLQEIWATCNIPLRRMQRYVFAHPTNSQAYLRVRQEWTKITTTYKEHDDNKTIDSVKEIEVIIDNAEAMRNIYKACGLEEKAIQETYRENRIYENVDISIDRRPWLKPFIEIEWASAVSVETVAWLLGFTIDTGIYGTVSDIYYKELGIPHDIINNTPTITFENPPIKMRG